MYFNILLFNRFALVTNSNSLNSLIISLNSYCSVNYIYLYIFKIKMYKFYTLKLTFTSDSLMSSKKIVQ